MTTLVRSLGLFAALAALTLAAGPAAPAQDKKDPKKDTAKVSGTIEVAEGKDGKFRFFVRGDDGKSLAQSSAGYASKEEAVKALDVVKAILASGKVTDAKKAAPTKDKEKEKAKEKTADK